MFICNILILTTSRGKFASDIMTFVSTENFPVYCDLFQHWRELVIHRINGFTFISFKIAISIIYTSQGAYFRT